MNKTYQANRGKALLLAASAALMMHSGLAVAASNEELEQRIESLEQQLQHQKEQVSVDAKGEEATYPSVKLFGYTQFGASFGRGVTPHQFAFDRVRLGARGAIDARIGYRLMVELLKLDKPAKSHTTVEGLLDAVLSWQTTDWLKLSAGQFKTPFSTEAGSGFHNLIFIKGRMSAF
ncbi:MAG: hypothetical protein AUK35_07205 [Zetaproteobacteria bacterium CG2_30_46_52]|nr:MAG: hypothetical protein AUK35_07205 [Zetaproteobacteria bacterium CG2_30_46_52]